MVAEARFLRAEWAEESRKRRLRRKWLELLEVHKGSIQKDLQPANLVFLRETCQNPAPLLLAAMLPGCRLALVRPTPRLARCPPTYSLVPLQVSIAQT